MSQGANPTTGTPTPDPDDRDATAAMTLAIQLMDLDREREMVRRQGTLRAADLRILAVLIAGRGNEPATLREIGQTLRLEQSTVNRQVNAALREGLLVRRERPGSTAAEVAASPLGRHRYQRDVALILDRYDRALAALGDRSDTFLDLFIRFVDAYREPAGTPD